MTSSSMCGFLKELFSRYKVDCNWDDNRFLHNPITFKTGRCIIQRKKPKRRSSLFSLLDPPQKKTNIVWRGLKNESVETFCLQHPEFKAYFWTKCFWRNTERSSDPFVSLIPEEFVCLILLNRFWVVHIPFVRMVKFQFLAQFQIDHLAHPVVSNLTLFLS